ARDRSRPRRPSACTPHSGARTAHGHTGTDTPARGTAGDGRPSGRRHRTSCTPPRMRRARSGVVAGFRPWLKSTAHPYGKNTPVPDVWWSTREFGLPSRSITILPDPDRRRSAEGPGDADHVKRLLRDRSGEGLIALVGAVIRGQAGVHAHRRGTLDVLEHPVAHEQRA